MKYLITIVLGLTSLTIVGQNSDFIVNGEPNLYSHAVDSLVKYILTKETPYSITLIADASVLNKLPSNIRGQELIKKNKKAKVKEKNNSIWIIVDQLSGTKEKRSIFIVITKYKDGYRRSWEGYGGYNFEYDFNASQNYYVFKGISKSIVIR